MANFTPETNQRIRALAAATAREVNALTDACEMQIKQIYDRFRAQAAAIKAEVSVANMQTYSIADMHDIDADFSESTPDAQLNAIRQEHEPFLTQLEALAVKAIASNSWDAFYVHVVEFQNEHDLHGEALITIGEEFNDPTITRGLEPGHSL